MPIASCVGDSVSGVLACLTAANTVAEFGAQAIPIAAPPIGRVSNRTRRVRPSAERSMTELSTAAAMSLPSGDQLADWSDSPRPPAKGLGADHFPVRSRVAMNMLSDSASSSWVNRIVLPSGDQSGEKSWEGGDGCQRR